MCAISLDVGTSSIKIAVIDVEGKVLFHKRVFFTTILTASSLYDYFIRGLEEAISYCAINNFYLLGISVSGNGPSIISVSKFGRADDVLLMWNDGFCEMLPNSLSIFAPRLNLFKKNTKHLMIVAYFFYP